MTIDTSKLRELALAATPGPWEAADAGSYDNGKTVIDEHFVRRPGDDVAIAADILDPETCDPSKANAAYIAAANPQAVLDLLDEIERINAVRREAQARVAELTTELQKMRVHLHRNTAAAMNDPATRWYVIDKRGFATLCLNWEDARNTAREADQAYPDNAPHVCGWMSVADMEGGAV